MQRWLLEAMGFNIQIMPLPEVYLAIQQGTVSGQENPDRHDPRQQVLRSRAVRDADQPRVQPDPADDLREDLAEAVAGGPRGGHAAAKEAADWSRAEVRAAEEAQLKDMESKGAKIGRPNLAPFRESVQPAYAKAKEKYGADVDAVLAEADAVRKATPK